MELHIHTMDNGWDDALWRQAEPIYDRAFPRQGRKTERILLHVVQQGIGRVHVALQGEIPVAMAVTGALEGGKGLLIDYLAVSEARRGKGIGKAFVDTFKRSCGAASTC